jgi:hypothetical protein
VRQRSVNSKKCSDTPYKLLPQFIVTPFTIDFSCTFYITDLLTQQIDRVRKRLLSVQTVAIHEKTVMAESVSIQLLIEIVLMIQ